MMSVMFNTLVQQSKSKLHKPDVKKINKIKIKIFPAFAFAFDLWDGAPLLSSMSDSLGFLGQVHFYKILKTGFPVIKGVCASVRTLQCCN